MMLELSTIVKKSKVGLLKKSIDVVTIAGLEPKHGIVVGDLDQLIKFEDFFTVEVLSKSAYRAKYHDVTSQAIDYLLRDIEGNSVLDYVEINGVKFIAMTEKTKAYVPNKYPKKSDVIGANIKRS